MSFNFDFSNDKPDIREPIPAGTLLYLQMTYTPGGAGPDGALTASSNTDAQYLKAEFTVLRGPYKGRKFWGNLTVNGGKVDEKGRSIAGDITRKTIRAILDSSQGLKSSDDSPEAMAKRVITGFKDLQGRRFIAKAKVEPAQNGYPAKNGLGQVMTVDMKGYPTSDAELDNPAVAVGTTKEAPPAPTWAGGASTTTASAPAQPTPAAQPTQTVTAPAAQTAGTDAGAIPAWAKAAA
jgi:hypothetical protein